CRGGFIPGIGDNGIVIVQHQQPDSLLQQELRCQVGDGIRLKSGQKRNGHRLLRKVKNQWVRKIRSHSSRNYSTEKTICPWRLYPNSNGKSETRLFFTFPRIRYRGDSPK